MYYEQFYSRRLTKNWIDDDPNSFIDNAEQYFEYKFESIEIGHYGNIMTMMVLAHKKVLKF